jgi:hypothetical protein
MRARDKAIGIIRSTGLSAAMAVLMLAGGRSIASADELSWAIRRSRHYGQMGHGRRQPTTTSVIGGQRAAGPSARSA